MEDQSKIPGGAGKGAANPKEDLTKQSLREAVEANAGESSAKTNPENKDEMRPWNKSNVVINLFLAVFTALLYFVAIHQTDVAERSLRISIERDSLNGVAQEKRDSVDRESFFAENRAYVFTKINSLRIMPEVPFGVFVTFKNVGKTPAYRVRYDMVAGPVELWEGSFALRPERIDSGLVIGPGEDHSTSFGAPPIPANLVDSIALGTKKIFYAIIVEYYTLSKLRRTTVYKVIVGSAGKDKWGTWFMPTHNDAD